MAKAPNPTGVSVEGNVMFYSNPQPLNAQSHEKFGVKQVKKPFEFMANQHFIPLTAQEFGAAATSFPVVFAPGEDKMPLAVMGVRQNENLFVNDGQFEQDFYMPAFARRYPFVMANDASNQRFVVCVDESADCVTNKKPERPFFENGQASSFTSEAIQFLEQFERDRQATQQMVNRFKELDLFEMKDMHFQNPNNADGTLGERQKIAEYFAVSEEKLRALDDKTVKELNESGMLSVAHAHLLSLGNWQRLVNMTLRRAAEEQAAQTKKKK